MTATVFYDNTNEIAQLTVTFTSSGSPANRATIWLRQICRSSEMLPITRRKSVRMRS